ncbi:MAG: hypothetical protein EOM69_12670, partial [Clostridia bacterium]|nr:hypothetical protein [Clostridia bacterium]
MRGKAPSSPGFPWDAGKTGVKKIELKPKTGEDIVLAVDKKGEILTSSQNQMIGKKLDKALGKGLADKIMAKVEE